MTLLQARLPDAVIDDVKVSMEFSGQVKLDIGPSPALAARLAPYAVPAIEVAGTVGAAAAAAGGALAIAAVIIGGTIYATEEAKREALQFTETLARRDGAASRAALETLGSDALVAYKQRELEWRKNGAGTAAAFSGGAAMVETLLRRLSPEDRTARRTAWAAAYSKNAGAADFTVVREGIFLRLRGYDRDDSDLASDLAAL